MNDCILCVIVLQPIDFRSSVFQSKHIFVLSVFLNHPRISCKLCHYFDACVSLQCRLLARLALSNSMKPNMFCHVFGTNDTGILFSGSCRTARRTKCKLRSLLNCGSEKLAMAVLEVRS